MTRAPMRRRSGGVLTMRPRHDPAFRFVAALVAVGVLHVQALAQITVETGPDAEPTDPKSEPEIEGTRRVGVFVYPARDGEQNSARVLETLLRKEGRRLEGITVATGSAPAELTPSKDIEPLVDEGVKLLQNGNGSEAETKFAKALDELRRYRGTTDMRLLARALKGRGIARVLQGRKSDGRADMQASLNVWPNQQPTSYGYNLQVVETFKEVRNERASQRRGALKVTTTAEGAQVHLDGEVQGYTPVEVSDLHPGRHWIQASRDGYVRENAWIRVPSDETKTKELALKPRGDLQAYRRDRQRLRTAIHGRDAVREPLRTFRRRIRAEEILVVNAAQGDGGYTITGWYSSGPDAKLQEVDRSIARDASFLEHVRTTLSELLGAERAPDEAGAPLDPPEQDEESVVRQGGDGEGEELYIDPDATILQEDSGDADDEAVTRKWWFWTIIGGVGAGLVTGSVFLFSSAGGGSGPVGDVRIDLNQLGE